MWEVEADFSRDSCNKQLVVFRGSPACVVCYTVAPIKRACNFISILNRTPVILASFDNGCPVYCLCEFVVLL